MCTLYPVTEGDMATREAPGTQVATGGGSGPFRGKSGAALDEAMKDALRECIIHVDTPDDTAKATETQPLVQSQPGTDMTRLAAEIAVVTPEPSDDELEGLPMPPPKRQQDEDLKALLPHTPHHISEEARRLAPPHAKPKRVPRRAPPGGGGQSPGESQPPPPQPVYKPPPKHCCVQCVKQCGESCLQPCLFVVCCLWLPCCKEGECRACSSCGGKCSTECVMEALHIEDRCMRMLTMSVLGMLALCCAAGICASGPILLVGLLAYIIPVFLGCRFRMFIPVYSTVSTLLGGDIEQEGWDCTVAVVYIVFSVWVILGGVLPAATGHVDLVAGLLYAAVHVCLITAGVLQLVGAVQDDQ